VQKFTVSKSEIFIVIYRTR